MRLGKEQAAGYVEDTGRLEDTAPVEDTMADALQAEEFTAARPGGMPLTPSAEPSRAVS